ncbi:hypothetical protein [Nocardia stercoris]|uniref:Nucleotidyltransferase domain-containing protein n=1 Tax=Nocardia stercoris TaxID=2483361 RepID=A0A3M2L6R9_9NOCA|nr:hypothetical protein [Nocardia stercoris]RMI32686.1 hypothetical protein EBN03_12015 [Nocardia stercoris]
MNDNQRASTEALRAMRQAALDVLPANSPRAVVLYGSYGRMRQKAPSDMDVLFIGERSAAAVRQLTDAIIGYSRDHGLALDEEVPYTNKVLVDWDELEQASTCTVFSGSPRLIPVRRHPDFLGSKYMRARLFVTGVLAQRTLTWSEDVIRLEGLRARAQAGLVLAAVEDLRAFEVDLEPDTVIEYLLGQGISSDNWLGFEPDPATVRHVQSFVERTLPAQLLSTTPEAGDGE